MWCAVSSFFIASFLCNVQTPNQPTPKGPTQTRGKKKSMSMCQAYQWNLVVLLINNDVSFFSLWLLLIGWALWGLIIVLDNKKWPVFGTIHIYFLCFFLQVSNHLINLFTLTINISVISGVKMNVNEVSHGLWVSPKSCY